jgi:hypothetical protein
MVERLENASKVGKNSNGRTAINIRRFEEGRIPNTVGRILRMPQGTYSSCWRKRMWKWSRSVCLTSIDLQCSNTSCQNTKYERNVSMCPWNSGEVELSESYAG